MSKRRTHRRSATFEEYANDVELKKKKKKTRRNRKDEREVGHQRRSTATFPFPVQNFIIYHSITNLF